MRRTFGLPALLALTLLPVNVAAQLPKQTQVPTRAVTEYQIKPAVSVDVSPNPATVNRAAQIRAIRTPEAGAWQFEFYMNGSRLTECASHSPVCDWIPKVSGEHSLIVLARFGLPSRGGGRGGRGAQDVRAVLSFSVAPEPTPIPTLTPAPAPAPQLDVRLLSDRVIAQQPARFEVSLTNATTADYLINMGDGEFRTRADLVFDHTFERDGPVTVTVRYAGVDPPLEKALPINVEPIPQATPTTTPEAATGTATGTGTGTTEVPPPPPLVWPYVLAGAVLVGAWMVARAISGPKNGRPTEIPIPPPVPTFHPDLKFVPRFEPRRTGGLSLVIIYARNLDSLRFSSPKTVRRED